MCSRYYVDDDTISDIRRLSDEVMGDLTMAKMGDIYPSETSFVLYGGSDVPDKIRTCQMRWGFPGFDKKLMINARSETALEKRTFSDSVQRRRCIIPAKHFYEWDAEKSKAVFTYPDSPSIFLAGFYNMIGDENRFVILTTAANESMRKIHDRMPLIFREEQIRDWIFDDGNVQEYLSAKSPMLACSMEYEQMSLF